MKEIPEAGILNSSKKITIFPVENEIPLVMKKPFIVLLGVILFSFLASGQKNVPVTITLKDGSRIEIYHFGKLVCESNQYAETFTHVRGKYSQSPTEISNYDDISQLILEGFTDPPMRAAGNQKGIITVVRKDGIKAQLEEAELVMSCYGAGELFNQIKVQILNPLTGKPAEQTIEIKDIVSISFK
jgi:hypothetical protein